MNVDTIREWTQSVLAVLIVAGGGLMLWSRPDPSVVPFVAGTIGGVVGFYFSGAARQAGANMVIKAQESVH